MDEENQQRQRQQQQHSHFDDDYDDDDDEDDDNAKLSSPSTPKISYWRLVRDPAFLPPIVLTHVWKEGTGTPTDPYLVDFLPPPPPPPPGSPSSITNSNSNSNNPNQIDIRNPLNLPLITRWSIACLNAFATLALTFASSAYTSALPDIERRLALQSPITTTATTTTTTATTPETAFLGTSLFVLGFALGPLVWAPLSEAYGRRPIFLTTYGLFVLLNALAAFVALGPPTLGPPTLTPNSPPPPNSSSSFLFPPSLPLLLTARGLGGMLGASALVNSSGGTADLFSLQDRGKVNAYLSAAPFLGPVLGPILGGFVSARAGGWTGVGGLITLLTALVWVLYLVAVPETYAPVLLRRRAQRLTQLSSSSSSSSNSSSHHQEVHYQSRLDKQGPPGPAKPKTATHLLRTALIRPLRLLVSETIVVVLSIYMAIIFGAMYLMFAAFPLVFQSPQGFNLGPGVGGLAFLGIGGGMVLALVYMLFANKEYVRIAKASPTGKAPPEARLLPARWGAVMAPAGLVIFAVTNSPEYHVLVPILGTVPFGFGMVVIFISLLAYLVDTYTVYAASAIAAATAVRSVFGAVFPLFTRTMFAKLGVHFGAGVPALLAALCLPFPFLFVVYGQRIREKAKFATEARNIAMKMAAAAAKTKQETDEEKKPLPEGDKETASMQEQKERPLSEAHGPTAEGEWQCYGRFCLGCSVDEDNFLVCRNAHLYEKHEWVMT